MPLGLPTTKARCSAVSQVQVLRINLALGVSEKLNGTLCLALPTECRPLAAAVLPKQVRRDGNGVMGRFSHSGTGLPGETRNSRHRRVTAAADAECMTVGGEMEA